MNTNCLKVVDTRRGTSFWAPIPLIILHLLILYGMYLSIVESVGR